MDHLSTIIQENAIRIFNDGDASAEDVIAALIADGQIDDAPVFVVDVGCVKRAYDRWRERLPRVTPHYAVKCNSDPVVVQVLAALGSSFDVASYNEISAVLEHAPPERLIFAHPIKNSKTISYARAVDVDLLTFDSSNELLKVALYHPNAELLLRLKVDDTGSACRFSTKFGADSEDVPQLLALARTLGLNVTGVSFHVGSGCVDAQLYAAAIEHALATIETARAVGMDLATVDIGGGFQSDTFDAFAAVIRPYVERLPQLKFIAEPGRLFVSDAATLVISVIGKKRVVRDGKVTFVIYANESVYGMFNNLLFDHQTVKLEPFNEREGELYTTKVYGRTCDSIDVIAEECLLPDLAVGERLFVRRMGAYTKASAASSFNGFEVPKTVYVLTTTPEDH